MSDDRSIRKSPRHVSVTRTRHGIAGPRGTRRTARTLADRQVTRTVREYACVGFVHRRSFRVHTGASWSESLHRALTAEHIARIHKLGRTPQRGVARGEPAGLRSILHELGMWFSSSSKSRWQLTKLSSLSDASFVIDFGSVRSCTQPSSRITCSASTSHSEVTQRSLRWHSEGTPLAIRGHSEVIKGHSEGNPRRWSPGARAAPR